MRCHIGRGVYFQNINVMPGPKLGPGKIFLQPVQKSLDMVQTGDETQSPTRFRL